MPVCCDKRFSEKLQTFDEKAVIVFLFKNSSLPLAPNQNDDSRIKVHK